MLRLLLLNRTERVTFFSGVTRTLGLRFLFYFYSATTVFCDCLACAAPWWTTWNWVGTELWGERRRLVEHKKLELLITMTWGRLLKAIVHFNGAFCKMKMGHFVFERFIVFLHWQFWLDFNLNSSDMWCSSSKINTNLLGSWFAAVHHRSKSQLDTFLNQRLNFIIKTESKKRLPY